MGLAVEWRQTALVYTFGILASEDRDEAKRRGAERPTRLDGMSVYGTKLPWPMPDHPFGMGGHSFQGYHSIRELGARVRSRYQAYRPLRTMIAAPAIV